MKKLLAFLLAACAALLLADLAYHKHGHYPAEEGFGFFPLLGLVCCAALALAARLLDAVTRRPADYYVREERRDR